MFDKILVFSEMLVFGEVLIFFGLKTCEGMEVPPMNHALVDSDRLKVEAHREEDRRKVR